MKTASTISLKQDEEIALLRLQNEKLSFQNEQPLERIAWFERQLFGPKSERIIRSLDEEQLLFEFMESQELPPQEEATVAAHTRKKAERNGQDAIAFPADLPVERVEIDLPEEEKVGLVRIGEEVSRRLGHRPGSFFIKEIVRPKYAHPQLEEEGVSISDLPDALIPRCQADETLLVDILVKKYVDHLPLYRISEIYQRDQVTISRQLLSQWVLALGSALAPLHEEMTRQILSSENIFVDEAPIALQVKGKGKTDTAYMWVIAGGSGGDPPNRSYHFFTNRRHSNAEGLLKGYQGRLHSDKYGVYEKLGKRKEIVWCPCWAHIRRKFFEAVSGSRELREWFLDKIQLLFMLEREAWKLLPEERSIYREAREVSVIDELITRANSEVANLLPKSKFCQALRYFIGLIPYLKNYIRYPDARLDNNVAERAIRPLALGRKNWLFMGSIRGGDAAAVILTLVQSCRSLGVDPSDYLNDILVRLPSHSNQRLAELLPQQYCCPQTPKNSISDPLRNARAYLVGLYFRNRCRGKA